MNVKCEKRNSFPKTGKWKLNWVLNAFLFEIKFIDFFVKFNVKYQFSWKLGFLDDVKRWTGHHLGPFAWKMYKIYLSVLIRHIN